jgi:hypothetical protein
MSITFGAAPTLFEVLFFSKKSLSLRKTNPFHFIHFLSCTRTEGEPSATFCVLCSKQLDRKKTLNPDVHVCQAFSDTIKQGA